MSVEDTESLGKTDKAQLVGALAVIGAVTVIAGGLIAVIAFERDPMIDGGALSAISAIVGGLIQSLNSPTGIGKVIASAVAAKPSAPA